MGLSFLDKVSGAEEKEESNSVSEIISTLIFSFAIC